MRARIKYFLYILICFIFLALIWLYWQPTELSFDWLKISIVFISMMVSFVLVNRLVQPLSKNYYQIFFEMCEAFALHEIIYNEKNEAVDYRILLVNPAFEQMTGLNAKKIVGKTILTVVPQLDKSWIEMYSRVAATREPLYIEKYDNYLGKYFRICAYSPDEGYFACIFSDITKSKKEEERLRKSENRYKEIVDAPFVYICRWKPDTTLTYANKAFAQAFRKNSEEIVGVKWMDLLPPDMQIKNKESYQHVLKSTDTTTVEMLHKDPQGKIHYISSTSIPIFDNQGIVTEFESFGQNVTDRKLAEETIVFSKKVLETKSKIAQMFLTYTDDQIYTRVLKIILESSSSLNGAFGYIQDNGDLVIPALGISKEKNISPDENKIVIPSNRWNGLWGKALLQKATIMSNTYTELPNGQPVLHAVHVPIIQKDKAIGLLMVTNKEEDYTSKDIDLLEELANSVAPILSARLDRDRQEARRKKAEERLDQAQALLQVAIQSSPIGILIAERTGKIRYANDVALEIRGKTTIPLTNIELEDHVKNWKLYDADGITVCPYEKSPLTLAIVNRLTSKNVCLVIQEDNNIPHWVSITASPILNRENEIVAAIAILQDITQNRQAEQEKRKLREQLVQAQKMESIGRLAAGVAHDFNNVLAVIMGYTDFLIDNKNLHEVVRCGHLEDIRSAAERARQLTSQLLAFSRKQKLEMQILNLNDIVQNYKKMLRQLVREDIEIQYDLASVVKTVKVDPSQIGQILMNLSANARDAMPNGGRLTIHTNNVEFGEDASSKSAKKYVLLSVSDTGLGMDENTIDHLFEPFFTTKEKGNGLGLATVYGIVKQHGGEIFVKSKIEVGTTFMIYLPQVDDIPKEENKKASKSTTAIPKFSSTILLVEDSASLRKMLRDILVQYGFVVLEASNALEALQHVAANRDKIELLLNDVVLPQVAGPVLAKQILSVCPKIKIIYMSGYAEDILSQYGISPQQVPFLQKPFTPDMLLKKIEEVLLTKTEEKKEKEDQE